MTNPLEIELQEIIEALSGSSGVTPPPGTDDKLKWYLDFIIELLNSGGGLLPSGGTAKQALLKKTSEDGDVEWANIDFDDLNNKPAIDEHELSKSSTSSDLGLATTKELTDLDIKVQGIQGRGGYLAAHDFEATTPTQEALTQYALTQIGISDPLEIWNGTHVKNLYVDPSTITQENPEGIVDGHVWALTNTPDTDPPIFEWVDDGPEGIGQATNKRYGATKGVEDPGDGSRDGAVTVENGEMETIGFTALKTRVREAEDAQLPYKGVNNQAGILIDLGEPLSSGNEILFDILYNETQVGALRRQAHIHGQFYYEIDRTGMVQNGNVFVPVYAFRGTPEGIGNTNLYLWIPSSNTVYYSSAKVDIWYRTEPGGLFTRAAASVSTLAAAPAETLVEIVPAYAQDRPDKWPLNVELGFGGNLYGVALAGTLPDWSDGEINFAPGFTVSDWSAAASRIQAGGGSFQKGSDATWHIIGYSQWSASALCSLNVAVNAAGNIYINGVFTGIAYNSTNAGYRIWLLYSK
jgi:hypothetical protein